MKAPFPYQTNDQVTQTRQDSLKEVEGVTKAPFSHQTNDQVRCVR